MLSGVVTCPGLFYPTTAADGILSRIRIPGGMINSKQFRAIAEIAMQYGGGYVDVTNRANLQIREIHTGINTQVLKYLQNLGLGSHDTGVDHIRNIMTSPTAGIDSQELIDTRPFVKSWDNYIANHPELSELPAKFSVGFDGGGVVSICDRLNDIAFVAVLVAGNVYFRLYLTIGEKSKPPIDMGIVLPPEKCLSVLAALANVYLAHINTSRKPKLRLRELLNSLGWENYLQEVEQRLSFSLFRSETKEHLPHRRGRGEGSREQGEQALRPCVEESETPVHSRSVSKRSPVLPGRLNWGGVQARLVSFPLPPAPCSLASFDQEYQHIGIHPQRQQNLFYIGVVLPLGRLETQQIQGLADLAEKYGSGTLRLTPWQNLLLTDIPQEQVTHVQSKITDLGLDFSVNNIKSALVACSGTTGCAAAVTDTKNHALVLAQYLANRVTLDRPVNIHFSGCEKSCAQHSKSDIALLGVNQAEETYDVYVGESNQKFGHQLYQNVKFAELPALIEQMLQLYKIHRLNPNESFGEFANRHTFAQLKQLGTSKN